LDIAEATCFIWHMRISRQAVAVFSLLAAFSSVAFAQSNAAAPAPATAPPQVASDAPPAPAASAPPPPSNVVGATYSDHPVTNLTDSPRPPSRRAFVRALVHPKTAFAADAPIATLPGFEALPDGGSRVFVQVTKTVAVEERRGANAITYVLKGAHVMKRNNTNPLVTLHMNTPVASARLVPAGSDLEFVVALRAAGTPTWRVTQSNDGASRLEIDFPKGTFVNANVASAALPIANARDEAASTEVADEASTARVRDDAQPTTAAPKKKLLRLTAAPPKPKAKAAPTTPQ
jgi:hypothetical protein